jgi:hypothetical protein
MRIDRRLLGWGTFFILVGAVPLAVRAGYLDVDRARQWPSLWPLLLIGWGVGLVLRRTPVEWLGGAVVAVTFGLMGGGALAAGFGGFPAIGGCNSDRAMTAFATQRGTLESGRLAVEFNCGSLLVETRDGSDWSVSGSEAQGRAPAVTTSGSSVKIAGTGGSSFFGDIGAARWTVDVPRTPAIDLSMTLNAGDGTADLSGATLASVGLTVNAGSFRLLLDGVGRLGDVNATVNAGDARVRLPAGGRSASVTLNAGNVEVCVPADAPLRVRWSSTLGANDLDEAGLSKVAQDTWVSQGFDDAQPHLELRVTATAGSFGLSRGGACDA